MNWTCLCYGVYLGAVSGDQYLAGDDSSEVSLLGVRALYAIAQGTMMNRRVSAWHTPPRNRTSH